MGGGGVRLYLYRIGKERDEMEGRKRQEEGGGGVRCDVKVSPSAQ